METMIKVFVLVYLVTVVLSKPPSAFDIKEIEEIEEIDFIKENVKKPSIGMYKVSYVYSIVNPFSEAY